MASGQGPEQYIQAQQETHVQLKKTDQNTRRGRRQQGVAQLEPDLPGAGHWQPVAVGGRGRPGRAPCFCQQMLEPLAGAEVPTDGPCTWEGPYIRTGNSGERGAALAQTHLHQFSADSENIDQREGGILAAHKGGVPVARPDLCPQVPAQAPSPPCNQPKSLPPWDKSSPVTQQLSGRLPVAHAHWLKKTTLPQQQSYCSCLDTSSLVREC